MLYYVSIMKKYVLPIVVGILVVGLIGFIVKGKFFPTAKAGLRVSSTPPAQVFLDGKEIGTTTLERNDFRPGEKTLRLVPQSTATTYFPWETKIKLTNGTLTAVTREFGETESLSAGEIITVEKIVDKKSASLAVISLPDSVAVSLNNETKGFSPVNLDKLTEGSYDVRLSASGYKERTVRIVLVNASRLILNVKLAEEEKEEETPSAEVTGTPTPSLTPSPTAKVTPKITPKTTPPPKPYILIKETPTGWLRVRIEPSISATESAKVNPGETYSLIEEKSGWYKIEYEKDKEGWVSGQYAEKYE